MCKQVVLTSVFAEESLLLHQKALKHLYAVSSHVIVRRRNSFSANINPSFFLPQGKISIHPLGLGRFALSLYGNMDFQKTKSSYSLKKKPVEFVLQF